MNKSNSLLWHSWARWGGKRIRAYRVPLISALAVGFLSYMFAFTNKLPNYDDVSSLLSKGATVDSGRWGLELIDIIFPNFSMPWIYGVITLILIALSVCLICHIFRIQNPVIQALLAGSIVAFPSLIGTFTFMFTASSYGISFLLAVLAVWVLQFEKKWTPALAVLCMVFSLSIYQSYISLTASLLVLVLIWQLFHGEDVKKVLRRGVVYLGFLIVSLGLYYLITQCVNALLHVTFNSYAASNLQFEFSALPKKILVAYYEFTEAFRGDSILLLTNTSRWLNRFCVVAAGILWLLLVIRRKNRGAGWLVLLTVLTMLLPLAINCMYLFTTVGAVHTMVLYGFVSLYVLFAILADQWLSEVEVPAGAARMWGQFSIHLMTLCMALAIIGNVYAANEAFLNLHLRYENTYAFYTALVADIQTMPGFDENTKVAIVGDFEDPYKRDTLYFAFQDVRRIAGTWGISPGFYSKGAFFDYYLGMHFSCVPDAEAETFRQLPEFAEMPCYPYYGSIRMIGDTIVVKLSD